MTAARPRSAAGTKIEGASRLALTLREAGSDLEDMKAVNAQVAAYVTRQSQPAAPQHSRALASTGRSGATKRAAVIRFGNNRKVKYARAIHGGRRYPNGTRTTARPWATRTAQQTEPTWSAMYNTAVQRVLNTIRGV